MSHLRWVLPLLGAGILAGCGGKQAPPGSAPISVYFLRDGKVAAARRVVLADENRAAAAIRALLEGPSAPERAAGLYTAIPDTASARRISVATHTATIRVTGLSSSGRRAQLGEIFYTLTQFPVARRVELEDGTAGSRRDFEDVTPAIFVESPAVGERVTSPIHLYGTANTFEANFIVRVLDRSGRVLREHFATATSGSGTRGTFDVRFPVPGNYEGPIRLVVFEPSAEDGRPLFPVRIPLELGR